MTGFDGERDEPVYLPGEARPIEPADESAQRIASEKHEQRVAGLTKLMKQRWFREWIMEHLMSLNTFGMTFGVSPTGFPDPNATFYHAGMKAAGEALFDRLDDISPEHAALMRRETFKPKT